MGVQKNYYKIKLKKYTKNFYKNNYYEKNIIKNIIIKNYKKFLL